VIPTSDGQADSRSGTPPPGYQLRLLQPNALADYKRLRDTMLSRHDEAFTSDAATELKRPIESYASRLCQGDEGATLFTLVAYFGREMVGAITCEREPRQKVRHIAHIVGMMVSDKAQGRGVGRALLSQALNLLRGELGLELVTLSVTSDNLAAVRLYEACGFSRYGHLPRAIRLPNGALLDKDLMVLTLHTPATQLLPESHAQPKRSQGQA